MTQHSLAPWQVTLAITAFTIIIAEGVASAAASIPSTAAESQLPLGLDRSLSESVLDDPVAVSASESAASISFMAPASPVPPQQDSSPAAPEPDWGSTNYHAVERSTALLKPSWLSALQVRPRLTASATANDNIFGSTTAPSSDIIYRISPGLNVAAGDFAGRQESYLALDYAPTALLYDRNSGLDTVEHRLSLDALYARPKFAVLFKGRVNDTFDLDQSVNGLVHQIYSDARPSITYHLAQSDFGAEGRFQSTDYESSSYRSWAETSGGLFGDLILDGRWRAGFGLRAGDAVLGDDSPDQTFQQVLGRFAILGAAKTQLIGSAGIEHRDFGGNLGSSVTWVVDIGGRYRPFGGTLISLDLFRRLDPSPQANGTSQIVTGATFGLRQRLYKRLGIGLAATLQNIAYSGSTSTDGSSGSSSNQFYSVRPSISYDCASWCAVNLFYQYGGQTGGAGSNAYTQNQFGIEAAFKY